MRINSGSAGARRAPHTGRVISPCYNRDLRVRMTTLSFEDQHTKDLIKQALLELLQERRDLFSKLFEELVEDVGLANALREAEDSEVVNEKEVLKALGG